MATDPHGLRPPFPAAQKAVGKDDKPQACWGAVLAARVRLLWEGMCGGRGGLHDNKVSLNESC